MKGKFKIIALIALLCISLSGCEEKKEQKSEEAITEVTTQGSVTIEVLDGNIWGYFGEIEIISDGTDGTQINIEMSDAWLVGTTDENFIDSEN